MLLESFLALNPTHLIVESHAIEFCVFVTLLIGVGVCVYNVFFHPLRSYPGPLLARATRCWYIYYDLQGVTHTKSKELHDKYGEVVRVAPNELSYNSAQALQDICGHRVAGKMGSFEKDMTFFSKPQNGSPSLQIAPDADHRRMRRLQAHAFSEKALKGQEQVMKHYVDLLISEMYRRVEGPNNGIIDMVRWYNFTTFDLIGDLAFGEPFGCLRDGILHPWIEMVFAMTKAAHFIRSCRRFPAPLSTWLKIFIPKTLTEGYAGNFKFAAIRARKRMSEGTDREDFMSYILRANDEKGMTPEEIESGSQLLISAGSETTATLLSGATYYLLKTPLVLQKLTQEIRTTFTDESQMNITTLQQLPYLNAVLEESLRLFPPVPGYFPRTAPEGGDTVCGKYVPAGTSVGVHQWATHRSEKNFRQPTSFVPERWLGDPEFETDDKKAMQPFSAGPRNCLGRNLAYAEMRVILARVLWNFDLVLQKDSETWEADSRAFTLWEKGPLNVKVVPVVRGN